MPDAKSSGADAGGSGARSREHNQGNQERKYTTEQAAEVRRIRRCQATAFYDILGLEEVRVSVSDGEIKRAYRKLSLLTHPDKNGHEHADEAFKMVSRAFSVLGDKEKREKFDKFGTDPDSRFGGGGGGGGGGGNPFAGFASRAGAAGGGAGGAGMGGGGAGMWGEEELSPEEIFARFFGGGGGGFGPFGGFDTGPQFVFNLGGGPGVRVHRFGGARPRGRPREATGPDGQPRPQNNGAMNTLFSLLPVLIFFVLPLLSNLFSSSGAPAVPRMVFDQKIPPYTEKRTTPTLKVNYFVNPDDVAQYTNYRLGQLDVQAELNLVNKLRGECELERRHRDQLMHDAVGWFFTDEEKLKRAQKMKMPSCDRLDQFGAAARRMG